MVNTVILRPNYLAFVDSKIFLELFFFCLAVNLKAKVKEDELKIVKLWEKQQEERNE